MKRFNSLSRDTRPQEQPEGTYTFGKNGLQHVTKGSVINEPGFTLSAAAIPYVPIGVLETDGWPVIMSTDNTNSAIGFYNYDEDTYVPILDDRDMGFRLGFSTDRYITGQTQRNYKGELVGAFTDKFLPPFYMNFDNPQITSIQDIRLFPQISAPGLTISEAAGGILLPGAYYAAVRLNKNDGTRTGYLAISAPRVIHGEPGQATDKAIQIDLTDIPDGYDTVTIAIVSRIAGVTKAEELANPIPASDKITALYTGSELTLDSTLEEILTPMAVYDRVDTMGQLNDALYIMGLHSVPDPEMQKYANLIRLRWHSELITADPPDEAMQEGTKKTFMHQEVYDFYIRYHMGGRTTAAFHIPGPALSAQELASSSKATAEGLTAAVFQVEDTISSYDATSRSGQMGKWQNETEVYPDTEDYDSSDIGGRNLRGKPVLHHRFPSIAWCKEHLYQGEPGYGRNKLDRLGISVENVIIPAEYADQITGWEILYARRSLGNSTVQGQSLVLFGARRDQESKYNPATIYSTGGNWNSKLALKSSDPGTLLIDQSTFRFHAFDILFNNPSLSPSYLSLQLKHSRQNIAYDDDAFIEDSEISDHGPATGPIVYKLDYLAAGKSPDPDGRIKAVKDTMYVPNNMLTGKWQNKKLERAFVGRFSNPSELLPSPEVSTLSVEWHTNNGGDATRRNQSAQFEYTFLSNLMALKKDLYVPFTGQNLVRAASSNEVNSIDIFFGGDTYISDYSFHTYGWWKDNADLDTHINGPDKGTRVVRRFICETAANLYARYEDPVNIYSKYYPKSSLTRNDYENNYLVQFQLDQDPNQFGYTKDSNALDDLISPSVFNTYAEQINDHPYRIHRGGKLSRQSKLRSWRTFLPLDYYEMQKNMGKGIHLEGMDDRLLIHMENALFLTQDKTKLESDLISVTLGSGDIFQFEPQEGLSAPRGYAGSQHDLACVRTPYGYVSIDSKQGQVFVYKGELRLVNNMLDSFMQQYLRVKEKNVFTGNGYTIGYDPDYKRILLTAKNKQLISTAGNPKPFRQSDLPSMTPGTIVIKNGRLQKFLGVNTTAYDCPQDIHPTAEGFVTSIPEDTERGTVVGTVTGTGVDNFYFTSTEDFEIEATTGKVKLTGHLDYYDKSSYTLQGIGMNRNGNSAPFTVVVNITLVNKPPVMEDKEVSIPDTTLTGTEITTMQATDREGNTLSYSILSGNTNSTFEINPNTGKVSVTDGSLLNGLSIPRYTMIIQASDGTNTATATLIVNITHVNRAPVPQNIVLTIPDTTPSGKVIHTLDEVIDPEEDDLLYTLSHSSVPGVFSFDQDAAEIKLVDNDSLNPAVTPQYVLSFTVTDLMHDPVPFTVTINVIYDRANLSFSPAQGSCNTVPSCPEGWTLSPDGSTCTKVTTQPADITQQNSCLAPSTNGVYGSFGARIYNPGFHNESIGTISPVSGDIYQLMTSSYWKQVNNAIGVWVDTDCDGVKDGLSEGTQTTILYKYTNAEASRRVYVGVFGDNQFILKVNSATICQTTIDSSDRNFKFLHIFPVNITNGVNIFNVVATGDGSVNDAVGLIIYDNSPQEIAAAGSDSDLNIIFSSESLRGTNTTIATCPDGFVLDDNDGNPICRKIEHQPPTQSGGNKRSWKKVQIKDTRRDQVISLVDNTENTTLFQDIQIPYYPPVAGSDECGGGTHLYLSAEKDVKVQKNDCEQGTGEVVTYAVPAGLYTSLTSQQDADSKAQADLDANKQDYANQKGGCS